MPVMNVDKFERFFRRAAGLDVDKADIKRYEEFINHITADLLLRGQEAARSNARDAIEPWDLPLTRGLQDNMREFQDIDKEIELQPILDRLTRRPLLDVAYTPETEAELPRVAGGLSVALARSFKMINPDLKNPQSADWDRATRLFDLLL
jgi:hypothetical protein